VSLWRKIGLEKGEGVGIELWSCFKLLLALERGLIC
jgi:hypothetical protein